MAEASKGEAARPPRAPWRFLRLTAGYWNGPRRWPVRGAILLLVLLTLAQVALAIWISYWNRDLFDALENRTGSALWRLAGSFGLIFLLTVAVTALHLEVKRWLQLDWRRWLTELLVGQWMDHARHYRLQFAPGDHDNPDARIAEDVRIATESAVGLFHSLLYSVLILGSFVDILLAVSGSLQLPGTEVSIPSYMVLAAFLYAGAGALLGLVLGRPLVRSTNRLQSVEANLRYGLARAREHAESVVLMHGEAHERENAARLFADVGRGWNRQTLAYLGIVSFSTGYGTLLPVLPILIAAPQYIAGTMTLGLLMQAAQAFQRLSSALSWPIDNLGELARCRASVDRIVSLHEDMQAMARHDRGEECSEEVCLYHAAHADLDIRQLRLLAPTGQLLLEGLDLHVRRGERVLITGDPAVTIALFKAVAGLWPWGGGEIVLPRDQDMMFVPQRPYLPAGSLRALLAYPQDATRYDDAGLLRALECAGIAWLAPRLDDNDDWAHALPLRAQQRLGIARVFLQQPAWIFIEEATDAFELKEEQSTMEMLHHELPDATLLHICLHNGLEHFYDRRLDLQRQGDRRAHPRHEGAADTATPTPAATLPEA